MIKLESEKVRIRFLKKIYTTLLCMDSYHSVSWVVEMTLLCMDSYHSVSWVVEMNQVG